MTDRPPPMTPDIRKALEPFAKEARKWSPINGWSKDDPMLDGCKIGDTDLTVGDLRRAREAWEGIGKGPYASLIKDLSLISHSDCQYGQRHVIETCEKAAEALTILATRPLAYDDTVRGDPSLLIDCAQFLDAMKPELVASNSWSDYDQKLRERITAALSRSETAGAADTVREALRTIRNMSFTVDSSKSFPSLENSAMDHLIRIHEIADAALKTLNTFSPPTS